MRLKFTISSANINIALTDYEISAYDFIYNVQNSKYAKGNKDERILKIKGDISRITETNKHILGKIRDWSKIKFGEETYYTTAKIEEEFQGTVIRAITFPNAFIKNYEETIDPSTGHGYFELTLMQKKDKRIDIIIEPFNEVFPTLGALYNKDSVFNKVAAAAGVTAAMAAKVLLNPDLYKHAGIEDAFNGLTCMSEDPVNLATGNFIYGATNFEIGGAYPLRFNSFYNSIDDFNGALGFNWHHSFEIKMVDLEDNKKEIIFEDGHRELYELQEDNSYKAPTGVHKKLETVDNKYILTFKDGVKYEFDEIGNLVNKLDTNGNKTEFSYNEVGLLSKVATLSGYFELSYDKDGLISTIFDNTGRKVFYGYAAGSISEFTDPEGRTFKYAYDEVTKRLQSIYDAKGNRFVYNVYNNEAKAMSQGFPDGGRMEYNYSPEKLTTELIERNGNKITYHYDENYRIFKEEFNDGSITKVFDDNNNIVEYTDKKGNSWKYEYDSFSNKIREYDPLGNETKHRYGMFNKLVRTTKPSGAILKYIYDIKGNLVGKVDELGNEISIGYNESGQAISLTNERGFTLNASYDEVGNRIEDIDALGNSTVLEYDELNRVKKVVSPEGNIREFTYTSTNKVKTIAGSYGEKMEYFYDNSDNVREVIDFNGNSTSFEYNEFNRPIKRVDALGNEYKYEYDHMWNLIREQDEDGNYKLYEYNELNKVSAMIDENGNRTEYFYDPNGNLIREVNALDEANTYEYDELNRVVSSKNQESAYSYMSYDIDSNLIKKVDYMGYEENFEYDKKGNLLVATDPLGNKFINTYDECSNKTTVKDPLDFVTKYEYNGKNKVNKILDPLGGVTEVLYNKNGKVSEVIDATGKKVIYEYDKNDKLLAFTNAEGYTTSFEYDNNGNNIAIKNPSGNRKIFEYDALNRRTSVTDEGGQTRYVKYDKVGRIKEVTNAEGAVTKYTYDKVGNVTEITDALGNSTTLIYDKLNRISKKIGANKGEVIYEYNPLSLVSKVIDEASNETTYEYDKNGKLISETNSLGETKSYEYNALGQVVKVVDQLGNAETFEYNAMDKVISATDKNGNTTRYFYDGNGNVVETKDVLNNSSYFEYDKLNRLVKMKLYRKDESNPKGEEQVTLYEYDGRGLVTKVINTVGSEKLFVYDENGNLIQKTDEDGYVTEYSYNSRNLVKTINYSNEKKVVFEYNREGKLVEAKDWLGTTKFELDLLNRIVAVNDHNDKTVKYKYDEVGNQVEVIYPDNTSVNYNYDILRNVTNIVEENGDVTKFEYDRLNRVTNMKYPNGLEEVYKYNKIGQVEEVKAISKGNEHILNIYEYDHQGNVVNEVKNSIKGDSNQNISYRYDELNRLVASTEERGLFNRVYRYDSLGNMVYEKNGSNEINYQIDNLNRLVGKNISPISTSIDQTNQELINYTYDKRGNLVREEQMLGEQSTVLTSFEYDVTSKMIKGTNKDNVSSIYNYNALGVLVGNEVTSDSNIANNINSNLEPQVKLLTPIRKDFTIDYTKFIPSDLVESQENGVSFKFAYAGRHKISADVTTGNTNDQQKMFYHNDRLGSSIFISDVKGEVKATANFDEWGNRAKHDLIKVGESQVDLVKSYTGHNYDDVLGVYYAKARMYNAKDKRFLGEDIVKGKMQNSMTLVPYSYVLGNPLKYIDPDGLFPLWTRGFMEDLGADVSYTQKYNKYIGAYGLESVTIKYNNITKTYKKKSKDNENGYTIKDGKAYIDDSVLSKDFGLEYSKYGSALEYEEIVGNYSTSPNCYAYVLGDFYHKSRYPGGLLSHILTDPSEDKIAKGVITDMEGWGESARIIENYNSDIYENERRIAARVSTEKGKYDFHFMMQMADGTWAEKNGEGGTSINHAVDDPNDISWYLREYDLSYDSDIVYLAITNNDDWD